MNNKSESISNNSKDDILKAYNILRGDFYRLNKELTYYKSNDYLKKVNDEHYKQIKSLNYQLDKEKKSSLKLKEKLNKQKDEIDRLREVVKEKQDKAEELYKEYESKISEYEKLIKQMEEKLKDLEDKNGKLMAQINKDFTNSSLPSSECSNRKIICNSRVKSNKPKGGQLGHEGHKRKQYEPNNIIELDAPIEVKENSDEYAFTSRYKYRDLVDLVINVNVNRYKSKIYRNKITGKYVYTPFPKGLENETNYGNNLKAFCLLLNNYDNVPIRKVKETLEAISDNKISLSIGTISKLTKEFSNNSKQDIDNLFSNLLNSNYMHNDATYIRNCGHTEYVYVSSDGKNVLYQYRNKKGTEALKDTPVENYMFTLIHDHDKSYYNFGSSHQKCLAHELRYLENSIQNESNLTWNIKMKSLLQSTIHLLKTKGIKKANILKIKKQYDDLIVLGENEYKENPPNKYYVEGYNTFKRLRDYKESVLYFLDHQETPYTNNEAELNLRKIKRKARIVGTFRSSDSISNYCIFMSLIITAKKNNKNIYKLIKEKLA